jgi:hypothetical protein
VASVFVLGPSLDSVYEPFPAAAPAPPTPGRRTIRFQPTPTSPGGRANLLVETAAAPSDQMPINIYVFFHQPISAVPEAAQRTADWFFKSGAPNSSIHVGAIGPDGLFSVAVPGVKPSLDPYFVQSVLEFAA